MKTESHQLEAPTQQKSTQAAFQETHRQDILQHATAIQRILEEQPAVLDDTTPDATVEPEGEPICAQEEIDERRRSCGTPEAEAAHLKVRRPMRSGRMLRLPAVLGLTGLSSSSVYAMMAKREFPRPIRLGKRAVGWPEHRISEWLRTRTATDDLDGAEQ